MATSNKEQAQKNADLKDKQLQQDQEAEEKAREKKRAATDKLSQANSDLKNAMDKDASVASANEALQKAKLNLAEARETWEAKNEALKQAQQNLSELRKAEETAKATLESATSEFNKAKQSSEDLERKLAELRAQLQAMKMLSEATDPSGAQKNNSNNKRDSQQPKAKQLANTGADITLLPVGAGIALLGIGLVGARKRRAE